MRASLKDLASRELEMVEVNKNHSYYSQTRSVRSGIQEKIGESLFYHFRQVKFP